MTRRERLERKLEKREEWAGKAKARAATRFDNADKATEGIPFGQPILVGHHSEKRQYRIEAGDDEHDWDSDYVGTASFALADAQRHVRELERRAATDPADPDECEDGTSWLGWSFRVVDGTSQEEV